MAPSKRKRSAKRDDAASSISRTNKPQHNSSGGEDQDDHARKKSRTVTAVAVAVASIKQEDYCLVSDILSRLKEICQSNSRCSAAIQAVPNTRFDLGGDNGGGGGDDLVTKKKVKDDHDVGGGGGGGSGGKRTTRKDTLAAAAAAAAMGVCDDRNDRRRKSFLSQAQIDANVLILATILLQKLLAANKKNNDHDDYNTSDEMDVDSNLQQQQQQQQQQEEEVIANHDVSIAIVQANMALLLSHILMVDKGVLERTINSNYGQKSGGGGGGVSSVSFSSASLSSSTPQGHSTPNTTTTTTTTSSTTTPIVRDAKTILVKTILTVMMTVLDSYKCISTICCSDSSSRKGGKLGGMTKCGHVRHALQCNLYALETLLCLQKQKPRIVRSSTPTTSSQSYCINDVGVPITVQHAHSLSMNPQGECVWNSLLWDLEGRGRRLVDGSDDDEDVTSSLGGMSSDGLVGTVLWDNLQVQAMAQECKIVSEILGVGGGTVLEESQKRVMNEYDCSWMRSVLLQCSNMEEETFQNTASSSTRKAAAASVTSPAVNRRRKAKNISVSSKSSRSSSTTADSGTVDSMGGNIINDVAENQVKKYLLDGSIAGGRVVVRRFCNMVFVHSCFGHYHLLQGLVHILNDSNEKDQNLHDDIAAVENSLTWRNIINPNEMEWPTFERVVKISQSLIPTAVQDIDEGKNKSIKRETKYITPTAAFSALSTRIVEILKESGKLCGMFPLKNGVEEFIEKYYNPAKGVVFTKPAEEITSTSSNKMDRSGRPSIYNITMEVLRLMIANHGRCLEEIALLAESSTQKQVSLGECPFAVVLGTRPIYEGSVSTGYIMLNEEEAASDTGFKEYKYYHPSLYKTIEALIRCVTTSSSANENKNCKVLFGAAAAFALQNSMKVRKCSTDVDSDIQKLDELIVFDAKLSSFAVHQFSDILGNIISVTRESVSNVIDRSASINSELIRHFSLNVAVTPKLDENFAGLFARHTNIIEIRDDNKAANGHLLSLFCRVMLPCGEKVPKSKVIQVPEYLVRILMSVVDGCFALQKCQDDCGNISQRKSNNFTRYSLAADCLDALRKFIEHVPMGTNSSYGDAASMVKFRSAIRKLIPTSILESFVYFGGKLEENIVHQKIKNIDKLEASLNGKIEYDRVEHRLWTSYVKCCQSFVRGTASNGSRTSISSENSKKVILGSAKERMKIFKIMAHLATSTDTKWPLYLPMVHHVIVSGQLSSDPIPRSLKDALPEKFICEGFLESIFSALNDPQMDILKKKYNCATNPKGYSSDVEIPLSVRDARLFVIALSRIPGKERKTLLSRFVNMLHGSLQSILADRKLKDVFSSSPLCTGFLARTLTVCSTIVDIVSAGDEMLDNLSDFVGQLHYNLPVLSVTKDEGIARDDVSFSTSTYRQESCFMSLWQDWESPALPCIEVSNFTDPLLLEDITKYRTILANSLEIGFESAKYDNCHLIFSSWNASAKICGFEKNIWTGPSTAKAISELTNAEKVYHIRNDIFHLYTELVQTSDDMPESYLSCRLQQVHKDHSMFFDPCRGVNHLKIAIAETLTMMKTAVSSLTNTIAAEVPIDDFILMEALLSYISFLLAMCTTSDSDVFVELSSCKKMQSGHHIRSSRHSMDDVGYSEDSDDSFEDDETHNNSQMDGLTKLTQLCGMIGASPCHPDWLDDSCHLRQGISEQFCLEHTAEIVQILTDFGIIVFSYYGQCLSAVFSEFCLDDSNHDIDASPLLKFVRGAHCIDLDSDLRFSVKDWEHGISQAFDVNAEILHSVFNGLPCKNAETAKELFASYSGQLIRGKLQDNFGAVDGNAPECRTGGEWELLLSNALLSPCCRLDVSTEKASQIRLGSNCIRWRRVLNCIINALVPANALLRFSLNGSKGRSRHQAMHGACDESPPRSYFNISCQTSPIHKTSEAGMDKSRSAFYLTLKGIIKKNLSFLGEVQSCSFCDGMTQKTALAAFGHLVTSQKDIMNLKGVLLMRNSLVAVTEFAARAKVKKGENLSTVLDVLLETPIFIGSQTYDHESYLLFCLKAKEMKISTIVEECIDLRTTLTKYPCQGASVHGWDWARLPLNEIKIINAIISGESNNITTPNVRSTFITLVKNILASEERKLSASERSALVSFKQTVLDFWGNLGSKHLKALVKNDICVIGNNSIAALSPDRCALFNISRQLSSFIVTLLSVSSNADCNANVNIMFSTIFNVLKETVQHWIGRNELKHIMCVLCILSIRYGKLIDIGDVLLTMTKKRITQGSSQHLLDLELFYRYLLDIHRSLSHEPNVNLGQSENFSSTLSIVEHDENINFPTELRTCTFVATHGEFTEQHWYNCYTCGLIWDKGCCSLCAQICHKGHDVGYSRKSSFFCDCGAEVRTSVGKISCKCLSPISHSVLASIYNKKPIEGPRQHQDEYGKQNPCVGKENDLWMETIKVMNEHFCSQAQKSIGEFVSSVNSTLICDLFDIFKAKFDCWLDKNSVQNFVPQTLDDSNESFAIPSTESCIMSRDGTQLDLRKLVDPSFSLIRVATTNTVSTSIVSSTNTLNLKANILTNNILERNMLAADSCGRMIVADSRCLLFYGALPLVNTRHISNPLQNVLTYPQLCVIGSYAVDFDVVGISICQGRERHVLVWGLTTAKCLLLGAGFDQVDISIDLSLELGSADFDFESDSIVKVEWVSGTIISVFCSTCVKLFDIGNKCVEISGNIACHPSLTYAINNHDATIRSGVVISSSLFHANSDETYTEAVQCVKRIYILLNSGQLHFIDFKVNVDGGLICADCVDIDCHDATVFPIAGIKKTDGSFAEQIGATSTSLGEGTSLVYLRQSRLLLYKCSSSPLVAFRLSSRGDIIGNFEFLPNVISGEFCGHAENEGITSPFSIWIELGSIIKENTLVYRAAFIGMNSKNRKAHIMYIEYDRERSFLKKLTMPENFNLTLNGSTSIDGLAAFSSPVIMGHSRNDGMVGHNGYVTERVYFASLASNGILTFHGEDMNRDAASYESPIAMSQRRRAHSDSGIHFEARVRDGDGSNDLPYSQPLFPVTIFEMLENVTNRDELVLTCDGVDETSKIMKKKLGTGSNEYIVGNSNDGCKLTISLRPRHELTTKNVSVRKDLRDFVIVAVRVLLGTSTLDFIPTLITVMGRPVKPARQKKRWYDVPLTDEEILQAARMGYVPIYVSRSTGSDQHQVFIDSVEVYAEQRDKLQHIFSPQNDGANGIEGPLNISDSCSQTNKQLVNSSISIISHVFQLIGRSSSEVSNVCKESLLRLVQVTALDSPEVGGARNHVIELLSEIKSDPKEKQMLLDEGTLIGICSILSDLEDLVKNSHTSVSDYQPHEIDTMTRCAKLNVLSKVNDCLASAISVIKDRPTDYKFFMENMIASGSVASSIALRCQFFVDVFKGSPEAFLIVSKLVEMTMFEILLEPCDQSKDSTFANLEFLSNLLRHTDLSVVRNACDAVARFLKDLHNSPTQKLVHKCDCCGVIPIKGTRFSMDESGCDIDLCSDCYSEGISYAAIKQFNPLVPVLVGDKPIVLTSSNGNKLNCHEIRRMISSTCVSYSTNEVLQDPQHDISTGIDEEDEDIQLQIALQMSLETRDNIRELLSSRVFEHLLRTTVTDLSSVDNQRQYYSFFIMNLLLTIVLKCSKGDQKLDLSRLMVETLCSEIRSSSNTCSEHFGSKARYAIMLYLRTLSSLMTEQGSIINRTDFNPSAGHPGLERSSIPTKSKTDPRFVCDTHGVPAVRRRCSHGEHKDRRFYVCGMNRKNRCKYFKWADELDTKANEKPSTSQAFPNKTEAVVNEEIRSIIWNSLTNGDVPLHQQLCMLLRADIKKYTVPDSIQSQSDVDNQKPNKIHRLSKCLQGCLRNAHEVHNDGSILSLRKLGSLDSPGVSEITFSQDPELYNLVLNKYTTVEALLDFIVLLGTNFSEFSSNSCPSWEVWFSPLCHIISKGFPTTLRNRAKETLKCMTGGKKDTYSQVRDRYVFAAQFMDLLSSSESPLQAALAVRAKARQCGASRCSNIISWGTLTTGDLLGVQDLISEDYFAVSEMDKMMKALGTLATTVLKSRRENWRYFCSLNRLPNKDAAFEGENVTNSSFLIGEIQKRSPITVLFWMICALPEYAQLKLIHLINLAVVGGCHNRARVLPATEKTNSTDTSHLSDSNLNTRHQHDDHTPEKILLEGIFGLSFNDVCAFVSTFVLKSSNIQMRNHAKDIALCLIRTFSDKSLQLFLQRTATKFMTDISSLGAQSIQFLQLITVIVTSGRIQKIDSTHLSKVAIYCFTQQAMKNCDMSSNFNENLFKFNGTKDSTHNGGLEECFDLSRCCCCQHAFRKRDQSTPTERLTEHGALKQSINEPSFLDAPEGKENELNPKWVDGQISDYKRVKLDHHRMVCSEFNCYVQLKTRYAIHEFLLNVSDQRGRFVKTITVYFSPRHVNDVNELMDACYDPLWQPCGTMSLAKGANKASVKVPFGVIAANIKFEYSEFYDKVNGGRTSAGAMVLHCPRCSRIVNNTLGGVCGHCGEVAFQCRKCRHINYDRLDAFLCVECGYCSSGTFSYEMVAGEATSAVSILDDDDLEKMVSTLNTQQKKYDEILSIFKKHIYLDKKYAGRKRSHAERIVNNQIDSSYGPMKRLLQGKFPKLTVDKAEVTKGPSEAQTLPNVRARSLLDLARQLRGDFSGDVRTSLSDILAQQARFNSGLRSNYDFDDDGDDNPERNPTGSNFLSFDMQDPLSQLLASIQARISGVSTSCNNGDLISGKSGTRESKDGSSTNNQLDILKLCYAELKGIEKDCSEMSKRIIAWKRLNRDSLSDYGSVVKSLHYLPVVCSNCAPKVAKAMLELIRELVPRNFNELEKNLSHKFISCLFDGQSTDSQEMAELKNSVLLMIYQNSPLGSDMILEELNARLGGGKDLASAEILGRLLQNDSLSHQRFVDLAVKILGG